MDKDFYNALEKKFGRDDLFYSTYGEGEKPRIMVIAISDVTDQEKNQAVLASLGISYEDAKNISQLPKDEAISLAKLARVKTLKKEIAILESEIGTSLL